ncbi:Acg family FMN-binding oxidoreductase [Algimonas porphyrae]|uniref:Twin-arginine translocation pathway signal protein n=1 Tax=Algimonas porphyrae TaxID=1128113 RepID=A0ABQ5V232_9PROT|nr:hypothetical protein [Algimonas porphyrae]GLQ21115.1 hypothetical protein GCM10007854_20700 [Algimonas porphyrae]
MNRRQLLITGTASILIASQASACAQPQSAYDSWRTLDDAYEDPRMAALAYAILSPSPHNRQPWLVDLAADDPNRLTLYPDLGRLLPETDPSNRQILIGLGAFVEAFSLAAGQQGRSVAITLFPEGVAVDQLDARPIAHITLGEAGTGLSDPLATFLPERRTNRTKFSDRPVPRDDLLALGTALNSDSGWWGATNDRDDCERLRTLCKDGWEIETRLPRTHLESIALTRIGAREIDANPDGISLSGGMMSAYAALGILTRDKMKDPNSRAFAGGLDFYNGLIDSAQSFGWLASQDNSRAGQLSAGRDWLRLHLAATRAGIALQPLSQVLQEFPEMDALYTALHSHMGVSVPARVQGLFRLGYADAPGPSPRWPLHTRLVDLP